MQRFAGLLLIAGGIYAASSGTWPGVIGGLLLAGLGSVTIDNNEGK